MSFIRGFLKDEKGALHLLILIAAAGLIAFLAISNTFNFKNKIFQALFPKPFSGAAEQSLKERESEFKSDELLIKFKKEVRGSIKEGNPADIGISSVNSIFKANSVKNFTRAAKISKNSNQDAEIFGWYKIRFDRSLNFEDVNIKGRFNSKNGFLFSQHPGARLLQKLISDLRKDPNIQEVEPNFVVKTVKVPNDPYYTSKDMWGMKKINPESAWDQTTGSVSIVVADIDTGLDRNHPDIKNNVWVNTGEISSNGIDDDGNGYIDDYYGWNFVNNSNNPMDDHGHGTHTAGTIGAVGNNSTGVVGVNWKVKIMALKFMDQSGSGYTNDGADALRYAADMGAKVSSNSWGCLCQNQIVDDAIKYEHDKGMVTFAAAGNSTTDALDFSPASSDMAMTISSTGREDKLSSFSNYGQKIDVAAPGEDILSLKSSQDTICGSTTIGTNYCTLSGTSMATPHVAGLAALILSKNPNLTNEEIRQLIRTNAVDLGTTGKDKQFGYGRVDVSKAISNSSFKPLAPIITSPHSRSILGGSNLKIIGSAAGSNFKKYKVEVGSPGREPTKWTTLVESTNPVTNGQLANVDITKLDEGLNTFRVTATDTAGKNSSFQVHDIEVDNNDTEMTYPATFSPIGNVNITGSAQTKNGIGFRNFKIEWGAGDTPTTWGTTGIILTNGGTKPIGNGVLATWDTTTLQNQQLYTLRLTVNDTNGKSVQYLLTTTMDKQLINGWPKVIDSSGISDPEGFTGRNYLPVIADLNADGQKEIILLGAQGKVYAYKMDGSSLPGFPANIVPVNMGVGEYFETGANVSDLDGDGKPEILAASQSINGSGSRIYIMRSDGSPYPGWPVPGFYPSLWTINYPTVADLDGDGKTEIVVMEIPRASLSGKLHAYHLDGNEIAGFPKTISFASTSPDCCSAYTPLSIADLDNDGQPEIAFGLNNTFYLFDNRGNLLPGWPFKTPLKYVEYFDKDMVMFFANSQAVGDISGDSNLEIFAVASVKGESFQNGQLYGWSKDGSVLPGFPKDVGIVTQNDDTNTPSLVDINKDGKDEVLVPTNGVMAYNKDGLIFSESISYGDSPVAVSDFNGDGNLKFATGTWTYRGDRVYDYITILNADGSKFWQRRIEPTALYEDTIYFTRPYTIFGDLDNDGKMELVSVPEIISASSTTYSLTANLYLWRFSPAVAKPKYEWPILWHDPARTGRLPVKLDPGETPIPTHSSSPIPTPEPATLVLTRYYNSTTGDHWSTTTKQVSTTPSGYTQEGSQGYLFASLKSWTVPFYDCAKTNSLGKIDHLNVLDPSKCDSIDYTQKAVLLGYIYELATTNVTNLYGCQNLLETDILASRSDTSCDNASYHILGIYGYTLNSP